MKQKKKVRYVLSYELSMVYSPSFSRLYLADLCLGKVLEGIQDEYFYTRRACGYVPNEYRKKGKKNKLLITTRVIICT